MCNIFWMQSFSASILTDTYHICVSRKVTVRSGHDTTKASWIFGSRIRWNSKTHLLFLLLFLVVSILGLQRGEHLAQLLKDVSRHVCEGYSTWKDSNSYLNVFESTKNASLNVIIGWHEIHILLFQTGRPMTVYQNGGAHIAAQLKLSLFVFQLQQQLQLQLHNSAKWKEDAAIFFPYRHFSQSD